MNNTVQPPYAWPVATVQHNKIHCTTIPTPGRELVQFWPIEFCTVCTIPCTRQLVYSHSPSVSTFVLLAGILYNVPEPSLSMLQCVKVCYGVL
jgi:hypothetical protein